MFGKCLKVIWWIFGENIRPYTLFRIRQFWCNRTKIELINYSKFFWILFMLDTMFDTLMKICIANSKNTDFFPTIILLLILFLTNALFTFYRFLRKFFLQLLTITTLKEVKVFLIAKKLFLFKEVYTYCWGCQVRINRLMLELTWGLAWKLPVFIAGGGGIVF